jgi:hypothetical protein
MPKSRLSAFISLLLVFLSGALVGAVGHRLYMVNSVSSFNGTVRPQGKQRLTPEEIRKHQIEEVRQKLGLNDQQIAQYDSILDNTLHQFNQLHDQANDKMHAEMRRVHDQQVEKVKAILRPEQIPLYDKWLAEREAERKRREQERDRKK